MALASWYIKQITVGKDFFDTGIQIIFELIQDLYFLPVPVEYGECCSDKLEHLLIRYKNPKQNKNLS